MVYQTANKLLQLWYWLGNGPKDWHTIECTWHCLTDLSHYNLGELKALLCLSVKFYFLYPGNHQHSTSHQTQHPSWSGLWFLLHKNISHYTLTSTVNSAVQVIKTFLDHGISFQLYSSYSLLIPSNLFSKLQTPYFKITNIISPKFFSGFPCL